MIKACRKNGLPDPEFGTSKGFFKVTLKNKKYVLKKLNPNEKNSTTTSKNRETAILRECINFTGKSERAVHRYLKNYKN